MPRRRKDRADLATLSQAALPWDDPGRVEHPTY